MSSSAPQLLDVVETPLDVKLSPVEIYARLRGHRGVVLLDGGSLGQSFIAVPTHGGLRHELPPLPFSKEAFGIQGPRGRAFLSQLQEQVASFRIPRHEHWGFCGGLVGWFGYDFRVNLEALGCSRRRDFDFPCAQWRPCHLVVAHDGKSGRSALLRLRDSRGGRDDAALNEREAKIAAQLRAPAKPLDEAPAQRRTLRVGSWKEYRRQFQRVQEHLHAGDAYQLNLSRRFEVLAEGDPLRHYARLRRVNPSFFGAFVEEGSEALLCVSPERFLRVDGQRVQTRPIKGTAPRHRDPCRDAELRTGLSMSAKDRAELAMIVDVMRNDLARVCRPGTVEVTTPMEVETHPSVHHLVAAIEGVLEEGNGPTELLAASLPGGSITGAPRISAMEIIDRLEERRRGPYTGSLGYLGYDGRADLNILIRSGLWSRGRLLFHGGGGITVESEARAEFLETEAKVLGFFEAMGVEVKR